MKRLFRFSPALWITFHALAAGLFLLSLLLPASVLPPVRFNTSLFDILPPSHSLKNVAQAESVLSARTSRAVTIFVESENFSQAKAAAQAACREWEECARAEGNEGRTGAGGAQSGADRPKSGRGAAQSGAVSAQSGADRAKSGGGETQSGRGAAQSGADRPKSGGVSAQSGADRPKSGRSGPGAPVNELFESISLYSDAAAMGELTAFLRDFRYNLLDEKSAALLGGERAAGDDERAGGAHAQSGADTAQSGADAFQSGADASQSGADAAQSETVAFQSGADASQSGADAAQSSADTSQSGADLSQSRSDDPQSSTPSPAAFASRALAQAYGSFTLTELDLESDPFLLTEAAASRLLSAAASGAASLSPKEDVLACQQDGKWYVLIRAVLTPEGTSLTNKKSAVKAIYSTARALEQAYPVHFIYSGVPFHSYESSSSAQKEITLISIAGILLIIAVFLFIFRSLVPAAVSAVAVLISSLTALSVTLLFFREVHVLTFVFGTTLIGTCIDYSIHYFVNWKANSALSSGTQLRRHIFRGIFMSFLSTEICFAALFIAPFPLLKQVSVFLFTGLLSSFLSVVCLYPRIPLPKTNRTLPRIPFSLLSRRAIGTTSLPGTATTPPAAHFSATSPSTNAATPSTAATSNSAAMHYSTATSAALRRLFSFTPLLLVIASIFTLFIFRHNFRIYNDLKGMYAMSSRLLENEKRSAQLLNTGSSGWYYIVQGDNAEEVLQKEELLTSSLPQSLSVSTCIPSKKTQLQSYRALSALLPLASSQYEDLGFSDTAVLSSALKADYISHQNRFLTPETPLPSLLESLTQNLWIGKIGSSYYSCVMPLHTDSREENRYQELARTIPGVTFVNKVHDIGTELDLLTKMMLILLGCAFIAVSIMLACIYPKKTATRIAAIPLIVTLTSVAVLTACGFTIGFFAVTSLVLVFGLGLDYIIYTVEAQKSTPTTGATTPTFDTPYPITPNPGTTTPPITSANSPSLATFAILLSFVTTALSFGVLAFTSFTPVHIMGLTVFAGLTAACLTAFAFSAKKQ